MSEAIKQDGPHSPINFFDILRKTILVGGGAIASAAIGLVRNKFVAVLLGPAGIALSGIFTQLIELIGSACSLGIETGGVRQIAASTATNDRPRLGRVVKTVQRIVWITGLLGALFMAVSSSSIARITFGQDDAEKYVIPIALLGLAVFFRTLRTGQGCIVKGMRRTGDFVRIGIYSAIAGVLASLPLYYWLGADGIVVAVIMGYAAGFLVTWWFSRRVEIPNEQCSVSDTFIQARLLMAFGLPIMLSGLVGTISPYFERVILLHKIGLENVGQYQAASSLAGVTVNFVLAAISADYYPRLVAHADKPDQFNHEMNAQLRVSLLLSIPAFAWLAVLSQQATQLLYSTDFVPAGEVLHIMAIGLVGRIFAAPIRVALWSKGKGKTSFVVETAITVSGLLLIGFFADRLGLTGCGWAFTILHLGTSIILALMLPLLTGQSISRQNKFLALWSSAALLALWLNHVLVSIGWIRITAGVILATCLTAICLRSIVRLMGLSTKTIIRKLLNK